MNRLWAPWRKAYIRPDKKRGGCFLCRIVRTPHKDLENFVLKRTPFNIALLNLYPYTNGHLMVTPLRHVDSLEKLTKNEKLDWLNLAEEMMLAMRRSIKPQGFNLGINMGRIAGAGLPKHLHFHVVPRWSGDVNFMPVIASTKVLSESMESVFQHLSTALSASHQSRKRKKS